MRPFSSILILCLFLSQSCEQATEKKTKYHVVESIALEVPKKEDWLQDSAAQVQEPLEGGVLMRLVRKYSAPGSPRIDIVAEKAPEHPIGLNAYLYQALRQMGEHEKKNSMRIHRVHQDAITLGARKAHLVHHEYTMGSSENEIAFTQLSVIMVIDGRGVTATALGRAEMFAPLKDTITNILKGIRVTTDPKRVSNLKEVDKPAAAQQPKTPEPIDLGVIDGR